MTTPTREVVVVIASALQRERAIAEMRGPSDPCRAASAWCATTAEAMRKELKRRQSQPVVPFHSPLRIRSRTPPSSGLPRSHSPLARQRTDRGRRRPYHSPPCQAAIEVLRELARDWLESYRRGDRCLQWRGRTRPE